MSPSSLPISSNRAPVAINQFPQASTRDHVTTSHPSTVGAFSAQRLRSPTTMAMASGPVKRSSSTLELTDSKRPKHHYYHHHRFQEPVTLPPSSEPAVQDDSNIDHMMSRSIGQALRNEGFEMADPAALSSLRSSAEECMWLPTRGSTFASRLDTDLPFRPFSIIHLCAPIDASIAPHSAYSS